MAGPRAWCEFASSRRTVSSPQTTRGTTPPRGWRKASLRRVCCWQEWRVPGRAAAHHVSLHVERYAASRQPLVRRLSPRPLHPSSCSPNNSRCRISARPSPRPAMPILPATTLEASTGSQHTSRQRSELRRPKEALAIGQPLAPRLAPADTLTNTWETS